MRHRIRSADGAYRWLMLRARPLPGADGRIERWVGSLTDIDDLQTMQQALRESEGRYRELVHNANSAIIRWRRDGTLTFFNEFAEQFFGYRAAEILGRHVGLLVPGHDSQGADLTQLVNDIVRDPARYANNVNENVCRDGRRVWMSWTNRPILDEHGAAVEILAIGSDITERIRVEQELRESREDLTRAQAVGRIGSWRLDVRRNVLTWSEENHRIFGVAQGTPLSYETFLATVHPDDRAYVDERWSAALRGEAYDIEHRIVVAGRQKWVRERAELEFDADGTLRGGFGTTQDITDIKLAQQALRESEERFQLASEIGRSGTWDWNVATGAVVWSRGHYEILGYRLGEVEPSYAAWAARVHPEDRPGTEAEIRSSMAARADYAHEFRVVWPDGSIRWMSARARYECGADGAVRRMVGVMADVTELKGAERRLQVLNAELSALLAERTRLADERAAHLRELAAQLTHAEQRERDRLYELLHDHVQPLLVGARLSLSGLDGRTPIATWLKSAAEVRKHIGNALETARSLSVELNPPLVRDQGLGAALEWLCRWVKSSHGLDVQFNLRCRRRAGRCRHAPAAVQGRARTADECRQACRREQCDPRHGTLPRSPRADHGGRPGRWLRCSQPRGRSAATRRLRAVEHRAAPGHDRWPHRHRKRAGGRHYGTPFGTAGNCAAGTRCPAAGARRRPPRAHRSTRRALRTRQGQGRSTLTRLPWVSWGGVPVHRTRKERSGRIAGPPGNWVLADPWCSGSVAVSQLVFCPRAARRRLGIGAAIAVKIRRKSVRRSGALAARQALRHA